MEFENLTVKELRAGVRHFDPTQRKSGSIACTGNKEQLIELLREKGIMPSEVKEYCEGNKAIKAPKEVPDDIFGKDDAEKAAEEYTKAAGDAGADDNDFEDLYDFDVENAGNAGNGNGNDDGESDENGNGNGNNESDDNTDDDELELIRKIITKKIKQNGVDEAAVGAIVDKKLADFRKKQVKVIEVKQPDNLPNKVVGVCHHLTEQISQVCNVGVHQMLVGPAGGGKTTCCEKVAEILNLKFYPMSVGPQTTKSDLLGFIDAAGNYHTTPLRDAFEHGGLLLLDEVDAANAGVLTIINALLANGYCSFPDGVIQRNENFRCICACNTYGRGADRQYVGRNQLDAATLDRFAVVDFDYDDNLERMIAANDAWVDKVQQYRNRAFELKMRVVISPRASIFGAKLLASGMKEQLVEELVIWKGVSAEIRSKLTA